MLGPIQWDGVNNNKRRKRKNGGATMANQNAPGHAPETIDEDAEISECKQRLSTCLRSVAEVQAGSGTAQPDMTRVIKNLTLQSQLDSSPADIGIKEIASYLTQAPGNMLSTETGKQVWRSGVVGKVATLQRAYEEGTMHEPVGSERHCRNWLSRSCFAGLIENNGVCDPSFGLCEFYTPEEHETIKQQGWAWPQQRRLCILCIRQEVFARFVAARCDGQEVLPHVIYSPISNIVGQRGEYCAESCFVSSPTRYEGVSEPVVIPTINDYRVVRVNGVRHLQQLLPRPEEADASSFFF